MDVGQLVYSRNEHGSLPIRVLQEPGPGRPGRFEVVRPEGTVEYGSTTRLLADLTGNPNHKFTFGKYFGREPVFGDPVAEWLRDLEARVLKLRSNSTTRTRFQVRPPAPAALPPGEERLGIDLAVRGNEVRCLLFAGFGPRMARAGYDPEDVLQEIYRGLLARNKGRCPFDRRKSSFGHYVHMVCECVLNNYHRRESRRRDFEQVGVATSTRGDFGGQSDAALAAERMLPPNHRHGSDDDSADPLPGLVAHLEQLVLDGDADPTEPRLAVLLVAGHGRREITDELGLTAARFADVAASLKAHAAAFIG